MLFEPPVEPVKVTKKFSGSAAWPLAAWASKGAIRVTKPLPLLRSTLTRVRPLTRLSSLIR